MTQGLQGSDPDELRRFAYDLNAAAGALMTIRTELGSHISNNLRWEGPDAFMFRHAWQSSYAPVIAKGADMLNDAALHLQFQADQQDTASS
ncbi:hypothetical protein [Arthrobacter cryoconiti]|uniref:WXG100 family type VII secretion target n=1 Tax=Arthrobacter cryoconiti TaxID=748907 RepID=A0ABV8R3U8_9MICC|nr:hypothetical protein [Arthrobacter cryoconiti]MCC9067203.1 hypothetical protein [Arthrobacter cryoconiti]